MINTLSIPRTSKLAILASALVYTGLSFGVATGAAPVQAAGAPYYTAVLSAPASDTKAVADGVGDVLETVEVHEEHRAGLVGVRDHVLEHLGPAEPAVAARAAEHDRGKCRYLLEEHEPPALPAGRVPCWYPG